MLAMLVAGGCKAKEGGDSETEAKPVVAAQTIVVTPQPFTETLGAIGSVTPRPGHVSAVNAPAQGRVAKVEVSTGQAVHADEPLIETGPTELRGCAAERRRGARGGRAGSGPQATVG